MASLKKGKSIPLSSVSEALEKGISQVDTARGMGLEGLLKMRTVKAKLLKREKKRLAEKLGPDHPRVSELALKAEVNQGMALDLSAGVGQARTEVPAADKKTWILHGYVRTRALKGIEGLTVALYDEKGNWIQPLGHACTDPVGYFRMNVQGGGDDTEKEKPAAAVLLQKIVQVVIHVLDRTGANLFTDDQPLAPAPGQVDYREIILGDKKKDCAPPPDSASPQPSPCGEPASPRSESKKPKGKRAASQKKTPKKK